MKAFFVSIHCALVAGASTLEPDLPVYESPLTLEASELLPADQLRGPVHRVRDLVVTDGFMAQFLIDTDFGTFEAIGVPQVATRIAEAEAIRALMETSKGDLFAEGLKRSINQPIDAVKNIVQRPVSSIKQVPKTVGHFFSKVGNSIDRGWKKMQADEEEGGGVKASELGKLAKSVAGFDNARLETAKQLGVDPYSDNSRLQDEMEKVTWAFFAGGLPLRIGASAASAGLAVAATKMVGIPEETYALTEGELALRFKQSLTSMGVLDEDMDAFLIHPSLSTTRRLRLVRALEALPTTAGRGDLLRLTNACESPVQADFLVASISMLAERQQKGAADYRAMQVLGRMPAGITVDDVLEVAAPVDYVTWTEQVAEFAGSEELLDQVKLLVHTGQLSAAAATGLATAGWEVVAVPYP